MSSPAESVLIDRIFKVIDLLQSASGYAEMLETRTYQHPRTLG